MPYRHFLTKCFFHSLALTLLMGLPFSVSSAPSGNPRSAAQVAQDPISLLEIPFSFPLDSAYQEAERLLPLQAGHWQNWKRRHGINTQYRAWRGQLSFQFTGDILLVQAHVRYWIKAQKTLLGALDIKGSCGVNEPPRQAIIGMQARLGWNPNWTLRPSFRVLPTRFMDRCKMTMANIDVTSIVGQVFRQEMEQSLRKSLQILQPRMQTMRQHTAKIWQQLNQPIQIAKASWLQLNPLDLALSPLLSEGDKAQVNLAVALKPKLSIGARPVTQQRPLPPLRSILPSPTGLRFQLNLQTDYAQLSQRLSNELASRTFEVEGHKFSIQSVSLSDHQQQLHVQLNLTGSAKGTAEFWTDVTFDSEQETFQLKNLDYTLQPEDPRLFVLTSLFYEKIRDILLDTANKLLKDEMFKARNRLETALANVTPKGAKLDLKALRLNNIAIQFTGKGIEFQGLINGSAKLEL